MRTYKVAAKIAATVVIGFVTTSLAGCAFGPLVSQESARTVGEGKNDLVGGAGVAGYVIKYTRGVTPNLDLGLQLESMSMGLRAKYAFLNEQRRGASFAVAGGLGTSVGGSHYYGDLMTSYLADVLEPYLTVRLVHVSTDPIEARDKETGALNYRIDASEYSYGQLMLGTRFWLSAHWHFTVEASGLFSLNSGVTFSNGLLYGGAFGYRF